MPKQPGKGSHHKRKEAAFERGATQHTDFIGQAEPARAEAEFRKHERVEAERTDDMVREMAEKLEEVAGDSASGMEAPFRMPRSLDEGKRLIQEAPAALREKARERLENLPGPAQKAVELAQGAAGLLFAPLRIGMAVAREVLRVPAAMFRVLRHREA